MSTSKISRKGLTTVPKEIREALGISVGDRISWRLHRAGSNFIVEIEALKNPEKFLKGRRSSEKLTYQRLEEEADRLLAREASA